MVQLTCSCKCFDEVTITTLKQFEQIKDFFKVLVDQGVFSEVVATQPYYSWRNGREEHHWYANQWYICQKCGCLWEFKYPDFPAKGFVRKFPDGIYFPRGY